MTAGVGLRANAAQFALLLAVNGLVGAMVGQERALLPLLAAERFSLRAYTSTLLFVVAFGAVKAVANFAAGIACDRVGRKPVLLAGWLVAVPVPFLLAWAPGWEWVLVANVLLGANQGLAWSATVVMKVDLAGPRRRGLAMGLNEAAGYAAVAGAAAATGVIAERWGLRPWPFLLGVAIAALGLGLSAAAVRETSDRPRTAAGATGRATAPPARTVLRATVADRDFAAICQAGLVNNLNDAMAWGLLPLVLAGDGLSTGRIGVVAAVYPGVWAVVQLGAGTLSDVLGRKWLITSGMLLQAVAIAGMPLADGYSAWLASAALLGVGTGFVYPSLIAAVGDLAPASWRASAVGGYRLWRDAGLVAGGLLVGTSADWWSPHQAILTVAALTAASGIFAAVRLRETLPASGVSEPGARGYLAPMADELHPGDRVEWNAHGGKTTPKGKATGRVVRKITSETTIKGHTAKATEQEPQYVVRTDDGAEAAHRPEALRRTR